MIKMFMNTDTKLVEEILDKLHKNGGYCPCATSKTPDTKCPCKAFREQTVPGKCHCGLFRKVDVKG